MEYTKEYIEDIVFSGLCREEVETCINFSRYDDNNAYIFTSDNTVLTRLKKLLLSEKSEYKIYKVFKRGEEIHGVEVTCPKDLISFRSGHRDMTEEQKQAAGERMKKMWEDKKSSQ